jgi:hypothetical protein
MGSGFNIFRQWLLPKEGFARSGDDRGTTFQPLGHKKLKERFTSFFQIMQQLGGDVQTKNESHTEETGMT